MERLPDNQRPLRRGPGELGRGRAVGARLDDVDLVGAILANGARHLAQPVDHLLFNLVDHRVIAEVHFANVDAAQLVAPFHRAGCHFVAHRLRHHVTGLEHVAQLHVRQRAHGGVRHVGPEAAAGVGILEQERRRVLHPHFVPDADAHRSALL